MVGRLLDYLGQRMMEGNPLTKKEMDAVSKFYLEQTAHVLGEYAYDDSEAKFKAPGLDGDEVSSLSVFRIHPFLRCSESSGASPR